MFLSAFSIRRPIAISMVILALVVIGVVGYTRLGMDLIPNMELPYVTVTVVYPGAGAREVETDVTKPLEDAVSTVSGVKHVSSYSSEGVSMVIIEFGEGVSPDVAAQDVRDRVAASRLMLPDDVKEPLVQKVDLRAMPVMDLAVSSRLDPVALRRLAEDEIKPAIERVEGVGTASIVGGLEREIRVAVDRQRLEAYRVSLGQLVQTLSAQNLNVPAGTVTAGSERVVVRVPGQFTSVEAIQNAPLPTPGGTIRVADIAQVLDTHKERETIARLNGRDALVITVQKRPEANIVQTAAGVRAAIDRLNRTLPQQTRLTVVLDRSQFAKDAVSDVTNNLILGGLLATVVVFFFLYSLRSTIVAFIALPVSVISSFGLMYFAGFTLNMISMLALALAIGLLIDDAIVVIENIYRHVEGGEPPREAANNGTGEIALAVMAITFTIVAVFAPIAFMGGIVGKFFREFGLTVAFAVLVSLLVSLSLTPMLASRLLRPSGGQKPRGVLGGFARSYERLDHAYRGLLDWALKHRRAVVATGVTVFVASLFMVPLLGQEFFPATEREEVDVNLTLPPGTSLEATDSVAQRVEALVRGDPDVEHILTEVGSSGAGGGFQGGGAGTDTAGVKIKLVPLGQRKRTAFAMVEWLRGEVKRLPGVTATVQQPSTMGGGGEARFQLEIRGPDVDGLIAAAQRAKQAMATVPGLVDLDISLRPGKPEVEFRVDRPKASDVGITVGQVASTLRTAVDGTVAGQYREAGKDYDIRVQLRQQDRQSVSQLETLRVPASLQLVPLGEVASRRAATGPVTIARVDKQRTATVTANIAEGFAMSNVQKAADEKMKTIGLPAAYTYGFTGEAEMFAESMRNILIALVLAVIFVFMILAAQFESLLHPFTIGLSLPFSLIGAILALLLTGNTLNIMAMIGIVMLMGLVTKNAILLVDYTNTLRHRGMERNDAILQAGPIRLRPILMTTAAMVFGMLPVALGLGSGAEMRAPMAIAVIGGLLSSLALTLVVVPVVYTYMDDLSKRLARREHS